MDSLFKKFILEKIIHRHSKEENNIGIKIEQKNNTNKSAKHKHNESIISKECYDILYPMAPEEMWKLDHILSPSKKKINTPLSKDKENII